MRHGYYPFYKEAPASYPLRLQQVITTILENDLPAVEKVEYVSIKKMKRLLMIVSQMVPSSCFIPKRIICSSLPKVYLENTNLMYALAPTSDIGNIRETFFANQLKANHTITFSGQGDFRIDDTYTFEVGGKTKSFEQIKDIPNSYLAIDNVEYGTGKRIPLWLFGFLY